MPHLLVQSAEHKVSAEAVNIPRAVLLMCGTGLLIGTSSAILKASCDNIPDMECVFFRSIISVIFLAGLMPFHRHKPILGTNKKILFLRGLFGALASMAYVWSIPRMDLGLANGMNQTSPIFVCIFAAIFLRERFHWAIYFCVFISFIGIGFVLKPDVSGLNMAAVSALASGILSGLAYTCVKKLRSTETTETIVLWLMGMTSLISLMTWPIQPWIMPHGMQLFGLIMTGVTALAGQLLMTRAYKYAPATIVAPFIYLSTFSSLIIAFAVWGESPGIHALIGCGIIIICAILIGILPTRLKKINS